MRTDGFNKHQKAYIPSTNNLVAQSVFLDKKKLLLLFLAEDQNCKFTLYISDKVEL